MAQVERFYNRNPFPVSIPQPTGGTVVVPSGQFKIGAWYRQFTGWRQLTREVANVDGSSTPDSALSATRPVPAALRRATPASPLPVLETRDELHYTLRNGIYRCKHCEVYATGGKISMEAHLAEMHSIMDSVTVPSMLDTIAERMKVSTAIPKQTVPVDTGAIIKSPAAGMTFPEAPPTATPMNIGEVLAKAESVPVVDEPEKPEVAIADDDQHACAQCDRVFKTEKGLSDHKVNKHGVKL